MKYTEEHEWVRIEEDGIVCVGITDHAQESLGDITFVELPAIGESFSQGDTFGVVESVKAASDLYMPLDLEVTEINEEIESAPETVNSDAYEAGWLLKGKVADSSQLEALLDPAAYQALIG